MPDFSPLPSPSNNPLQNLKVIAQDTTIYIAPGWLGSAGKTGSAGSWTGQTLGNDNTGDGTAGKPFATLKKAWETAQQSVISGNATLTIQFQKGIYDLNGGTTHDNFFPDNLYHPQGSNIIIQGDPVAVKQKYLWRVANYTWDLAKFSHWGHTGEVYLWNLSGGTAHGFTGEDEGGYVAISNVSLGSAEYYDDPSQISGTTAFRDVRYDTRGEIYNDGTGYKTSYGNWGNHFFSHAYRYEDSDGILGLAKIYGASGSADALGLAFKNQNFDSRVIGFYEDTPSTHAGRIAPGISNSGPWAGISASWPESQYSKPNGYYGLTAARNVNYPALPAGVTHISDEIFTVTNYPVVIRSTITSAANKTPIAIRGGKIKAIRNLFFTTAAVDGVSSGSQSLSYSLKEATPDIKTPAPSCIHLDEMSELGIRHIGICGYDNGIRISNSSKVKAYTSIGLESLNTQITNQHDKGSPWFRADSQNNPLDNTPVVMMHLVKTGILCGQNSELDTTLGYSNSMVYLTDASVWIQSVGSGVYTNSSKVTVSTMWSSVISGLPCFRLTMNIPVFGGSTSGLSAGFYNPESWDYNTYRDVRFLATVPPSSGSVLYDYLGRIYGVAAGATFQTDTTENSGWTGSTWSKSAGFAEAQPLYTQRVHLYGYWLQGTYINKWHDLGGRYVDFRTHITDGQTLEIRAYSDQPGTSYVSGLCFSVNSLALRSQNGSYIVGTTASRGFTASVHRYAFLSSPGGGAGAYRDGGYYMYGGVMADNILVNEASTFVTTKMLNIRGGVDGLMLVNNSTFAVRSILTNVMCTETAHSAIRVEHASNAAFGNIFVKNIHPGWALGGRCECITIRGSSRVWHHGNMAAITWPITGRGAIPLKDTSDAKFSVFGYWGDPGQPRTIRSNVIYSSMVHTEFGRSEFDGMLYQLSQGWGHRVCLADGAEGSRTESINNTPAGISAGGADAVAVVWAAGLGTITPISNKIGQSSSSSTEDDLYSFSRLVFAGPTPTQGFQLSSRKPFGANAYPTKSAVGTAGNSRYQWWLHDKVGQIDANLNSATTGTWKIPVLLNATLVPAKGSETGSGFVSTTNFNGNAHPVLSIKEGYATLFPMG